MLASLTRGNPARLTFSLIETAHVHRSGESPPAPTVKFTVSFDLFHGQDFWILAALMTAVALAFVLVPLLARARPPAPPRSMRTSRCCAASAARSKPMSPGARFPPTRATKRSRSSWSAPRTDLPGAAVRRPAREAKPLARGDGRRGGPARSPSEPTSRFGSPACYRSENRGAHEAPRLLDDKQIVAMVESLARKVRERPDDAQGWGLLARSMAALGRFQEAAEAYEHLAKLVPRNAQVLADYADALGMAQGRTLAGRPYQLVREALAVDPKHRKALALAGTAALDANDFAAAARYWEALAAELPAGSDDAAQVRAIIAEVPREGRGRRERARGAGPRRSPSPPAGAGSVSGSVSVAPGWRRRSRATTRSSSSRAPRAARACRSRCCAARRASCR